MAKGCGMIAPNMATMLAFLTTDADVPREYSMATAALLPRLRTWVTSEYEHGGLRSSGQVVLDHLLDLAKGRREA